MSKMTRHLFFIFVIGLAATHAGCRAHDFERGFFSEPLATRVERSRQLSLEQQYQVFRYANDVIHPPLMDMADPIAERGKEAVPFLLKQLQVDETDIAVRDIVLIFERMALLRTYDVKSNPALLDALIARVVKMKDRDWQAMSESRLKRIKDTK